MIELPFGLRPYLFGGGTIEPLESGSYRLELPPRCVRYSDSQMDDYHHIHRNQFPWSPPIELEVRARASGPIPIGTLGFGFWNDPFTISLGQGGAARRFPATPQALWFFYGSSENDIRLTPDLPGSGWRASSIRSPRIPMLLLSPLAPIAVILMTMPFLRSPIMKIAQRGVEAIEAMLDVALDQWHTYSIQWKTKEAIFSVDGEMVLRSIRPPSGPLGFVAWIDNQFAVASPEKGFRFGVIPTQDKQWLDLEIIHLRQL
jgi:hypothetical protein